MRASVDVRPQSNERRQVRPSNTQIIPANHQGEVSQRVLNGAPRAVEATVQPAMPMEVLQTPTAEIPVPSVEQNIAEQKPSSPEAPSTTESAASATTEKRAYPAAAEMPTQQHASGIRFDFNDGCRIVFPEQEHPWRVRLSDLDTGNILFETELKTGRVNSMKRYFVRFRVEVWQQGKSIIDHEYTAADREILVQFPVGTLGDTVGWLPYAVKFQERHKCRLTCAIADKLIPLFSKAYPHIKFVTHDDVKTRTSSSSLATSVMSACIGPRATSSVSIRPKCRRTSRSTTTPHQFRNRMSASGPRARRRANIGITRMAGANSSHS
jgi:hypothetical protein